MTTQTTTKKLTSMTLDLAIDELDAMIVKQYLTTIAQNLSPKALAILAEKSTKKGIEERLIKFKNMI